jgi:transposase-like protein
MTTTRLTDSDKRQIVELYRQPGETTLTLAERYSVSNTTISRILKSSLSPTEYEGLIQQKRSLRAAGDTPIQGNVLEAALFALEAAPPVRSRSPVVELETAAVAEFAPELDLESDLAPDLDEPYPEPERPVTEKRVIPSPVRKPVEPPIRKSRQPQPEEAIALVEEEEDDFADDEDLAAEPAPTRLAKESQVTAVEAIRDELIAANLLGDAEDDLDDDDEDDEDDEEDEDEDDFDDAALMPAIQISSTAFITVLPITEATMPKTCYLVVDRSAELVARPLREFGELGQIPTAEIQEKTMPVFDNHRVAKRFSNPRTQRVIKVPDSRILQKTAPYLQAKGITRLLIEGQVYAL